MIKRTSHVDDTRALHGQIHTYECVVKKLVILPERQLVQTLKNR